MIRKALWTTVPTTLVALFPLGATELTLEGAMVMARQQAREVLAERARAEAGSWRLRQAKGSRLPQLSLQEVWLTTENPAEVFALQLNQERFSFQEFVLSDPNHPDWLENASTRLLLTQPVYTGGEIVARIDQAQAAAEAAQVQGEWASNAAALAAGEAYVRLAQARENVSLLEQVLQTLAAHVARARAYVEQGMLVRSELLRAQVEKSRIDDLLAEARGQARVAEANLSFRLAAEADSRWQLQGMGEPLPIEGALTDWLRTVDGRADLRSARRLLDAAELEIQVQRAALMPKLALAVRYELFGEEPFGSDGGSGAVMAMASLDLFSGNRHRAARAAAAADFEAARQQVEQFAAAVRLEVREAYERALSARERHRTATAAQAAAAEAERITEERFRQGVVNMLDLLDSTTARQEARTRELMARTEAHLTALTLAVKAGHRPETMLPIHPAAQTRKP